MSTTISTSTSMGPWQRGADARDVRAPIVMTVRDADEKVVAFTTDEDATRLIAESPALLAQLKTMVAAFLTYAPKTEGAEYNCVLEARALIAKIEGGAV